MQPAAGTQQPPAVCKRDDSVFLFSTGWQPRKLAIVLGETPVRGERPHILIRRLWASR
jgi:hypothetical protein